MILLCRFSQYMDMKTEAEAETEAGTYRDRSIPVIPRE